MANLLPYLTHLQIRPAVEEQDPGDPPGEGGGQPQILPPDEVSDTEVEVTVSCPPVPGADRIEFWAGSNSGHWSIGSQENPTASFTPNEVVFTAPRQATENDNSFFCYQGANDFGSAPNYHCNGFTIPAQEGDPDTLGAPNIGSAVRLVGPAVRLDDITPGMNADQHDVHRVPGDVDFTASAGNLIDEGIGQAPSSYDDPTVEPTTFYSYRLRSRAEGFTPRQSNRVAIETLGEPVGGVYPNLPSDLTTEVFQHDCHEFPDPGTSGSFLASGGGRITHHSSGWISGGNDGGTFTGAIPSSAFVQGPRPHDGVPTVMHGPLAPHGQAFVHRIRYSPGSQGNQSFPCDHEDVRPPNCGTANGGTSKCAFRAAPSDILLKAWYIHFWVLFEGFHYVSPVDGPTRVIPSASQYRMAFQNNNNLNCSNQGGLFGIGGNGGGHLWGRDADTGTLRQLVGDEDKATHTSIFYKLGVLTASGSGLVQDHPGNPDTLGNGRSVNNWKWEVGNSGSNWIKNSDTRTRRDGIQVGRWHQVEFLGRHSDVDTMNGSIYVFLDGNPVPEAFADPITTRRSNFPGPCGGGVADGWYNGPNWYRGYHPTSCCRARWVRSLGQHARYASFADYYMAGIPA